jgi:hypothetical protein
MSDRFHLLSEPLLQFGLQQEADDPHDGLALFGPAESRSALPDHVAIGTSQCLDLWGKWVELFNAPAACDEITRHRPWPPFPGYDVAYGCRWPRPAKGYALDAAALDQAARRADRFERAYAVANLYLDPIKSQVPRLDAKPAVAVCIVPDDVYTNCRPKSHVSDTSDAKKTEAEKSSLAAALKDRRAGQPRFDFGDEPADLEQYGMSPDFRRQLKARVMQHDLPIQIVRESTLLVTDDVRLGHKGVNPLSDRLWNMGTALFYKSLFLKC